MTYDVMTYDVLTYDIMTYDVIDVIFTIHPTKRSKCQNVKRPLTDYMILEQPLTAEEKYPTLSSY